MKIELKDVLVLLTICSIVGGFLWFVLGRILTDKKDKMLLTFEVEALKTMVNELKKDCDHVDNILREIEVIKEKVKHL